MMERWNVRKMIAGMEARRRAQRETSNATVHPAMLPAMSAEWWRTIPDDTFRLIVTTKMHAELSHEAWTAIRKRAAGLGIRLAR